MQIEVVNVGGIVKEENKRGKNLLMKIPAMQEEPKVKTLAMKQKLDDIGIRKDTKS